MSDNTNTKTVSNARKGSDFEKKAQHFFLSKGIKLELSYSLPIGLYKTKKSHRFDLGNETVIVECKAHKWTKGDVVPSAKMTIWNEAMYYFLLAPAHYQKILFVLKDIRISNQETLAEYYIRTYPHFIPKDVTIWEYDAASGQANIVNRQGSKL